MISMNVSGRKADEICETEQHGAAKSIEPHISRRMAMGGVAFFGAAMSAISSRALAQPGAAPGSYSNSAIAAEPPGDAPGKSEDEIVRAVKIARAMRSGPRRSPAMPPSRRWTIREMSPAFFEKAR